MRSVEAEEWSFRWHMSQDPGVLKRDQVAVDAGSDWRMTERLATNLTERSFTKEDEVDNN